MEITKASPTHEIVEALKQELKGLEKINDSPYKTNMRLEPFGDLKSEKKVANLIKAFSSVLGRQKLYDEAQQELGVEEAPEFTIEGGSVEDWKADIQLQIKKVTFEARYNELKELIREAEQFMTAEEKKDLFIAKMQKTLNKTIAD